MVTKLMMKDHVTLKYGYKTNEKKNLVLSQSSYGYKTNEERSCYIHNMDTKLIKKNLVSFIIWI